MSLRRELFTNSTGRGQTTVFTPLLVDPKTGRVDPILGAEFLRTQHEAYDGLIVPFHDPEATAKPAVTK
jgi:hypothetical protein